MRKLFVGIFSSALLVLSSLALAAPLNINTADAPALAKSIKGVGSKRAEAIVAYRKEHGPFKTVDELTKVKGINAKIVEDNRSNLTVNK